MRSSHLCLVFCGVLLLGSTSMAQVSLNTTVLGTQNLYASYNDVWGYSTLDSRELALIGTGTGTSIVDVTNPASPTELAFVPGVNSPWRDIKTHSTFAYVVTEGAGGGMQIIDLEATPPTLVATYMVNFDTSHNIAITDSVAYVVGASSAGSFAGTRILSLANPTAPVEIGSFQGFYIHDCVVRNGVMYAAAISNDLIGIVDVSNPASPTVLTTFTWPGSNAHNCDLSTDGNFLFTSDEVSGGDLHVFNISDLQNVTQVATYTANSDAIIHNVLIKGNFAYISYYTEGVRILDIANPEFPVEVAFYDTWPGASGGFDGNWGVYPELPSGNILISDILTGLYVISVNIQSGAVEGTVTESGGGTLRDVLVSIQGGPMAVSSLSGFYKIYDNPGLVNIDASLFGFEDLSTSATLAVGSIVTLNLPMTRLPNENLDGTITNSTNGAPISEVSVQLENSPWTNLTDAAGGFDFSQVPFGVYVLALSRFGFVPERHTISVTTTEFPTFNFNFAMVPATTGENFEGGPAGWTVGDPNDTATTGVWEWNNPIGSGGGQVQPEDDHTVGSGSVCWFTGNAPSAASSIGVNDVDGGQTTLTSALFDASGMSSPRMSYWRWFINDAGSIPGPADTLQVLVSNNAGATWSSVERLVTSSSSWIQNSFAINDILPSTALMRLRFIAQDVGSGSIVEAAIDDIMLFDSSPTDAGSPKYSTGLLGNYPNPFNPQTSIQYELENASWNQLRVFDVQGRLVRTFPRRLQEPGTYQILWRGRDDKGKAVASGVYLYQLLTPNYNQSRRMLLLK